MNYENEVMKSLLWKAEQNARKRIIDTIWFCRIRKIHAKDYEEINRIEKSKRLRIFEIKRSLSIEKFRIKTIFETKETQERVSK